jgi:hypothetical protein
MNVTFYNGFSGNCNLSGFAVEGGDLKVSIS